MVFIKAMRFFSSIKECRKAFESISGGSILMDLRKLQKCAINLTSTWTDACEISYSAPSHIFIDFQFDSSLKSISVIGSIDTISSDDIQTVTLNVFLPEHMDTTIFGNEISLASNKKILGKFSAVCSGESLFTIDKLRGANIEIISPNGDVIVTNTVEGNNIIINARQIDIKKGFGDTVNLNSTKSISIGALYAPISKIIANNDITIGQCQGNTKINSQEGNVTISGLEGSCQLSIAEKGDANVHIGKLLPLSASTINTKDGSITLTLDPELSLDLRLQTGTLPTSENTNPLTNETDNIIARKPSINILSPNFNPIMQTTSVVTGKIVRSAMNINSNNTYTTTTTSTSSRSSRTSGKISKQDANLQSMNRSKEFSHQPPQSQSHGVKSSIAMTTIDNVCDTPSLDLSATNGSVTVETVTWMDNLKKKYGIK